MYNCFFFLFATSGRRVSTRLPPPPPPLRKYAILLFPFDYCSRIVCRSTDRPFFRYRSSGDILRGHDEFGVGTACYIIFIKLPSRVTRVWSMVFISTDQPRGEKKKNISNEILVAPDELWSVQVHCLSTRGVRESNRKTPRRRKKTVDALRRRRWRYRNHRET